MKVLLIGEYSGLHTMIAEELKKNSENNIHLVHDGDGYKKIEGANFVIENKYKTRKGFIEYFFKSTRLLSDFFGIKGFFSSIKVAKEIKKMSGYDVVQLINTKPFPGYGAFINIYFIYLLKKQNNKIFLLAVGDDYNWVKYCLKKEPKYSMFDYFSITKLKCFFPSLLYVYGIGGRFLNNYVLKVSSKVIPMCYDYYAAYKFFNVKKLNHIIPLPIKTKEGVKPFLFKSYPIEIFHGWQPNKEFRKGNDIFDRVIRRLIEKYSSLISYNIVSGVDYQTYQKKFSNSAIFIDQCVSYDLGVNALLGMSEGKVVFSGFESECEKYYNLNEKKQPFVINATPNEDDLYNQLEWLVKNPKSMEIISANAIEYVLAYRDIQKVTSKIVAIWKS